MAVQIGMDDMHGLNDKDFAAKCLICPSNPQYGHTSVELAR